MANNLPNNFELNEEYVTETVESLRELYDLGKPGTDLEIENRIDQFFEFCQRSGCRPGVETLALSLHVTRTTIFNWSNGIGCSSRCANAIQKAKSFINAFLEQSVMRGKINPVPGLFLMKNWMNYKDSISLEDLSSSPSIARPMVTTQEIMERYKGAVRPELPDLGD